MYRNQTILLLGAFALTHAPDAYAYIGPTLGIGVVGTVLAVIAVILLSLVAFVVMPIRRMLKKSKKTSDEETDLSRGS